ncbi:MAG: carbohydrate ABC transporter permease [Defluviitaleaceae bacterium]|nr:carbohydrate ABC transporter permease [Defluviitaleaceae bacterium]
MTKIKTWVNSSSFENTVQKNITRVKNLIMGACMAIIIVGVCYIILSPIFGIISRSFMHPQDLANPLIFLIPQNFTLQNINYAIRHMHYWRTLAQTMGFALGFSVLHVAVCSMVGYGFARFKFPGANILFAFVILTIVVPVHSYMVPMFINFSFFLGTNVNLLNTYFALGLLTATGVGLRSGLYIYIFRQFFRGLPKEIEEAAFIDGAGPFYTYIKVMMPNAIPAIVTVFLFSFVWHYNDTFYTSLLMPNLNFLSTRLMGLGPTYSMMENVYSPALIQMVVFAGVMLAVVPILTIYLFLQRYFVEGLERSGIVG